MKSFANIALVIALSIVALSGCRRADAAPFGVVKPYTRCPIGSTLVIQPMGDSITAGPAPNGGFRSLVLSYLATARGGSIGSSGAVDSRGDLNNTLYGYNAATTGTSHSGHPGSSAAQWVANGWMATFTPGGVDVHFGMLMLGANDADAAGGANSVGTLIDQFFSIHPQANLFVANRLPQSTSTSLTFNAALASVVDAKRALGNNVVLVDAYSTVSVFDLYDGLHPTDAGNRKIADAWINAMAPYVRQ